MHVPDDGHIALSDAAAAMDVLGHVEEGEKARKHILHTRLDAPLIIRSQFELVRAGHQTRCSTRCSCAVLLNFATLSSEGIEIFTMYTPSEDS